MRTPTPLPPPLGEGPFRTSEARAHGVPVHRLRARDLRAPYRGLRTLSDAPADDIVSACREFAPLLAPGQFYSHTTALALYGCPVPPLLAPIPLHVAVHRPAAAPRTRGIIGHRLQRRDLACREHPAGFAVEDPARAWRQAGYLWPRDSLIAAGDHLISRRHAICAWEDLAREVDDMGDMRGRILDSALPLIRDGAESPRETELRLAILRSGLPEPLLNEVLLADGGVFVARFDMSYPRYRVAVEYDGRQHATDPRQFAHDADRWEAVRREGWRLVRILDHHLRPDPAVACGLIRDALLSRGWRG